ncbi:hypothetical protein [Formosa sp. A9]|uniref:hypothetical protein n=1 Tax=Formosa sp. A9 TaxID=3442641 RepID=UPI003EC0AB3C
MKAQLSTASVISSNMVLQQQKAVPIWGTASPNERIKITFGKQTIKGRADKNGNWQLLLHPMLATQEPQTLVITGETKTIKYDNILIGEVWLASGQSNMEYAMVPYHEFLPPQHGSDLAKLALQEPANNLLLIIKNSSVI